MTERTIAPESRPEEVVVDAALRPRTLTEMVGQDRLRENLEILIRAARARNEPLDHVLFYGPPGLGKCIVGSSLVLTDTGLRPLDSMVPADLPAGNYAPCSTTIYGTDGSEPASHTYRQGKTATIRLRTRSGFELEGTPNHPILVATADGPRWRPLGELTSADFVAIACDTHLWGQTQRVIYTPQYTHAKLRRILADRRTQAAHELLTEELHRAPTATELGLAVGAPLRQNPTARVAALRLDLPLSDGRAVGTQVQDALPIVYDTTGLTAQMPDVLDADLAYFMGLLVGDGHVEKGQGAPGFVITASEPEIQAEVQRIAAAKFGVTTIVHEYPERAPRLRFSQNIGHLMLSLGVLPVTAGDKVVPKAILASPEKVVIGFLQGLFDADGHAWRQEGYVDFCTKSETLARQVQLLLANLGVIAHRTRKTTQDKTYWQLFIGGRDAMRYAQRVGFRLSRKREALNGLHDAQRGWSRSDIVPFAHLAMRELFDASRPHSHARHKQFYHVQAGDRMLSRAQIARYLDLLPEWVVALPAAATLAALSDEHIYWDRVTDLATGEAEVYDFCVPGTHSFVANGFFNHNTTLSHVLANEMGVGLKITAGPAIERAGDLAAILTNLRAGDILFIDEVHRLGRAVEEVLYPAMEDFALDIVIGKGPSARSIRLKLPRFTLIGATTRLALMTAPLRARFGAVYRFDFYEFSAMEAIVARAARLLQAPITPDGIGEIARRGRGTPRVALRLLRRVRDYAQVRADGTITPQIAREALTLLDIDALGLDTLDRNVLSRLIRDFRGGPVGLETIAASLSEESDTIMDVVEPYLLQLGFLERTPRGRVATRKAYEHLGEPYPETGEQPALFDQ